MTLILPEEMSEEKRKRTRSRKLKWICSLYIRDGRQCIYCGREMMTLDEIQAWDHSPGNRLPNNYPTLDHVTPKSEGGVTALENLVIACSTCNNKKGNRPTYVAKQQVRKFSTELGTCPECRGVMGREMCRICRGAGALDTTRYFEVVDILSREASNRKKKNQQQRSRIAKLEAIVSEYDGNPGPVKDRQKLLAAIDSLKRTVQEQGERIAALGGSHRAV